MGLVNKLKNILFEEEEVEIPVIEKKEKKQPVASVSVYEQKFEPEYKEMPRKEEVKREEMQAYANFYDELEPVIKEERMLEEKNRYQPPVVEKEPEKKPEKSFNFPDFDEEEFQSVMPTRSTNVLDYERKKQEKKPEYKEYQRTERKEEVRDVKVKFKPSPIISPVYGILDKNYTPDEITSRTESLNARSLDVDSVRKKAFGTFEESEVKPGKKEVNERTINERVEKNRGVNDRGLTERFEKSRSIDDRILEERLEKARTIDELLKDSSDEVIELNNFGIEEELGSYDDPIDSLDDIDSVYDEEIKEDTLESDLFDLIDSMYENREDGE